MKRYVDEMVYSAFFGGLAGLTFGVLWAIGILDFLPSRHAHSRNSSYFSGMTIDRYVSNLVWYPVFGVVVGVLAGAVYGFFVVRERLKRERLASEDRRPN